MARLAAIDIGSNAIRLRIVDVEAPHATEGGPVFRPFKDVLSERAPVRLGHDVFTTSRIEATMIARATETLKAFRVAMDSAAVDRYRAVATSACREAKNADVFVERAEREAGVFVEVIEGVEEARLVQAAVKQRIDLSGRLALLIDIGGGSTELTLMRNNQPAYSRSLPMGTVRLIEAFLDGGGALDAARDQLLDEYIDRISFDAIHKIAKLVGTEPLTLVGTGGNIDTLAELAPLPLAFPESKAIDVSRMAGLLAELSAMDLDTRCNRFGLRPDRADTIVPAAKILGRIAAHFQSTSILAPGIGLKEGVLVDLCRQHFVPRDFEREAAGVRDACLRLGRRYHFDEKHGATVARFATSLFDDLAPQHGLGPRDRVLLLAAAMLHDVGDFVRYEGHHKHSQYIISHSDIMGVTPAEREIVANVARYHRKSVPSTEHENYRALSRDGRSKVKMMAGLLRVADALDREHRQVVEKVSARVSGSTLWLDVSGGEGRALEEWTVKAKSGLLRELLGLEVRIADPLFIKGSTPPVAQI